MSVVQAKIQTVEEMYRLVWTAVANKQPIKAINKDRIRLFCPADAELLGREKGSIRSAPIRIEVTGQ